MMRTIIVAVVLAVGSFNVLADFSTGLTAFRKGDYTTALKQWKPLAEQGDAEAQYNLGMMYSVGLGVAQDDKRAKGARVRCFFRRVG